APNARAISVSRASPVTRDSSVKPLTVSRARNRFMGRLLYGSRQCGRRAGERFGPICRADVRSDWPQDTVLVFFSVVFRLRWLKLAVGSYRERALICAFIVARFITAAIAGGEAKREHPTQSPCSHPYGVAYQPRRGHSFVVATCLILLL